jgi:hypothetical protein
MAPPSSSHSAGDVSTNEDEMFVVPTMLPNAWSSRTSGNMQPSGHRHAALDEQQHPTYAESGEYQDVDSSELYYKMLNSAYATPAELGRGSSSAGAGGDGGYLVGDAGYMELNRARDGDDAVPQDAGYALVMGPADEPHYGVVTGGRGTGPSGGEGAYFALPTSVVGQGTDGGKRG